MKAMAILLLASMLSAGLAIAYITYRQLDTSNVQLRASAEFEPNGQGALCGEEHLTIAAHALATWLLPAEDGQDITGTLAVAGDETADIGISIWSPANRVVLFEPGRVHQKEFAIEAAVRGEYRFELDNRHSAFTDRQVTLSICLS